MTDRHSGYVVVLKEDVREDDAETIINALRMVKGVLSVEPVIANHSGAFITENRVRAEIREKLIGLAREI